VSTCAKSLGDFKKEKFYNGGKYGLGERKSQRANCTKVSVQFVCTCTWIAMGGIAYICGLHQSQSCMYMGCRKVNCLYAGCIGHSLVCTQVAIR
jgi:hypothetical protein